MWTYLLGPLISVLPKRWREMMPFAALVRWKPATIVSGFVQFVVAIIALMYWYSYSMTTWIDRALELALSGKIQGMTDHDIGITALILWISSPLTWALGYCGLEGVVRFCGAAFSDSILGTFPLFLIDKVLATIFGRGRSAASDTGRVLPGSFVGAIREKIMVSRLPQVADELRFKRSATEEVLEIFACRRKADWIPPRVVRYQDAYYRLEECSEGTRARPFRYVLRRLSVGVPGRSVLLYSPE
jgi:hypothetical protein